MTSLPGNVDRHLPEVADGRRRGARSEADAPTDRQVGDDGDAVLDPKDPIREPGDGQRVTGDGQRVTGDGDGRRGEGGRGPGDGVREPGGEPVLGSVASEGLSVSQLAERSNVGVPSIHHYRRLGLLPPPVQVAANRFRYDQRHVEALWAIRLLREQRGLSLAAIREVLPEVVSSTHQQAFRPDMWDAVLALSDMADGDHDETRARLLDAARGSFAERGYGGVNVEQLCHRAGIAKGSFYRYFASKDTIYAAAAWSVVDVAVEAVRQWPSPLRVDAAVPALAGALRPLLPLLLEVVVRAAHGDDSLAGVVPSIVERIAAAVGPLVDAGDSGATASSSPSTDSGATASSSPSTGSAACHHPPQPSPGALGRLVAGKAIDSLVRTAVGLDDVQARDPL